MKFSWKMLNYFINLESIKFEQFIEKLTLAGFEVEEIEEDDTIKDKIIHLSITANRKEIFCLINLAREIQAIFNLPLKINLIQFKPINKNIINNFINSSKQIVHIKINTIINISSNKSPKWLKDSLIGCKIKPSSLLKDIQEYIKIKWGHEILIYDLDIINIKLIDFKLIKIATDNNLKTQEKIIYDNKDLFYFNSLNKININNTNCSFSNKTNKIVLCFFIKNTNIHNLLNSYETFNDAYNEAIQLITTYCKATINKSYESSNITKNHHNKLKIKKDQIKNILGPLINQNTQSLSNQTIKKILNNLKLQPKYLYNYKTFQISIPKYREHDLKRDIDIIEEIGRIHGFKYFADQLPKYRHKGKISLKSVYIKKIRNNLLNMGFDEVINSSLTESRINKNKAIDIYNPMTEEQNILRTNIIKNLIDNYNTYIKQKNFKTEIFEIGNVFYKNKNNNYIEQINLGGIITNINFFKTNWYSESKELEWFHAKGMIEFFLDKLQANIKLCLKQKNTHDTIIKNIQCYLDPNEQIFIYNKRNYQLIGSLAKLNKKYINNTDQQNQATYIFEINIQNLIESIYFNKHINYAFKAYSLYPSVVRDISIKMNKYSNINKVKFLILQNNKHLIEYIEIINEYYNQITQIKSICLRIVYRSFNKTLNNNDLNNINNSIQKLLIEKY